MGEKRRGLPWAAGYQDCTALATVAWSRPCWAVPVPGIAESSKARMSSCTPRARIWSYLRRRSVRNEALVYVSPVRNEGRIWKLTWTPTPLAVARKARKLSVNDDGYGVAHRSPLA